MNTIWKIISIASLVLLIYQTVFQKKTEYLQVVQEIPTEEIETLVSICEEMPRFPGCENSWLSKKERQSCANNKMLEFVYSNLKHQALVNHFEEMAVVQFIIKKDGDLTDIEIKKGLSPGLGKDLVNVVKKMPKWIPGKQNGKAVNFRFTLPVRIHLE